MNSVKIIALAIALSSMSANAYEMMSSYDQKQDSKIDFATNQAKVANETARNAHNFAWEAKTQANSAMNVAKGAQQSASWANEEAYYNSQQIMGIQRDMSQMNKQFSNLSKQINDVEKTSSKGIAGVAAMTNIPALTGNKTFSFGMGVGNFNSETAISAGFQSRVHENVVTKVSFATDGDENVLGAGASFEW
ncbi:YadA-like family protein [Escherichia coli]|uniref:YadA-like family protein n=1 Tax=Escherichia coli TaxID=562 RepID=UPI002B314F02|nr:hypothetical protein VEE23_32840 [Escherichia coli]HCO0724922.1 YadA-like family protein [Escherichia coli]